MIKDNFNAGYLRKILEVFDQAESDDARKTGAVMVIFLETDEGPGLLFTKRAARLNQHAGQISFPGGAVEKTDGNYLNAALRETEEEIGIKADELEVIGRLPRQAVLDQWMIYPFAALWKSPRPIKADPVEVDRVIICSLQELTRQHHQECWLPPDPAEACRYILDGGEILWGATARIIGRLLDKLIDQGSIA